MRSSILGLLCFSVGLLLGQLSATPRSRISEPSQLPKNLVRLKALFGLAKDFEAEKGRLPGSIEQLEVWCKEDSVRRDMFAEVSRLPLKPEAGIYAWIIPPAGYSGDDTGFYIRSGGAYFRNHLPYELGVDRGGQITFKRP